MRMCLSRVLIVTEALFGYLFQSRGKGNYAGLYFSRFCKISLFSKLFIAFSRQLVVEVWVVVTFS